MLGRLEWNVLSGRLAHQSVISLSSRSCEYFVSGEDSGKWRQDCETAAPNSVKDGLVIIACSNHSLSCVYRYISLSLSLSLSGERSEKSCTLFYYVGSLRSPLRSGLVRSSIVRSACAHNVTDLRQRLQFVLVPFHAGIASQNAPESISERLKFQNFLGGTSPDPHSRCALRAHCSGPAISNPGSTPEQDHS